jgi:hypothetical protein
MSFGTHVITQREAREITKGRKPHVPVEYEQACKALEACQTLDEAKYWNDKADALAAWAKIYRDDDAGRKARALKLWAFRRMGELAAEIRPRSYLRAKGQRGGQNKGPQSLLAEHGLTKTQREAARALANSTKEQVAAMANLPRPPSPNLGQLSRHNFRPEIRRGRWRGSDHPEWPAWSSAVGTLRASISRVDARVLARSIRNPPEVRAKIQPLIEWLDAFEQHLPKEP